MGKTVEEEVKEVLEQATDNIAFEESLEAKNSPLNQPVAENEIGHSSGSAAPEKQRKPKEDDVLTETIREEEVEEKQSSKQVKDDDFHFKNNTKDDVPEQEIGSGEYDEQAEDEIPAGEDFEIPNSHAKRATDAIFGIADNVISVGGGFFIKIRKHKEFYDFEEVIQIIDQQNEKNIKRLKLDEDDKILLRPLLIAMLKQKAKQLTPEQQLLAAVLSILMKKAQLVMEIKVENEIMVERILDVIREEKGYSDQDVEETSLEEEEEKEQQPSVTEQEGQQNQEEQEVHFHEKERNEKHLEQEHLENETVVAEESITTAPDRLHSTLLEVADDDGDDREEE
ncbi:MAG TPA: hypothetical protein VIN73_12015 [Vicingaceae bacterium]